MDSEGVFRCYEIKVSKSDLYSKAAKSFLGHYNYFVMPGKLWDEVKSDDYIKHYLIRGIGVYAMYTVKIGDEYKYRAEVVRKAKKQSRVNFNIPVLMHCMIRSLSRYCKHEFDE